MKYKKIIIFGGTSEISFELLELYSNETEKFIIFCRNKLREKKFFITNLDINIIAEKPKISKYINIMKNKIAQLLKININLISIKATTNEKIGFIGNGEGIAAEAIVQISNEKYN